MKSKLLWLGTILLFVICKISFAQAEDQTLSPYFAVQDSTGNATLPLRHTEANVNVAGMIADVTITQVYQNTSEIPIEAIYTFPSSTRAAVYAMQMKIGKRTIEAKVKERTEARNIYETAKTLGQTASLLEEQRPNVFQMNVANIRPGDSVVVQISYTELLQSDAGTYEFVFPTVVGPRYSEVNRESASPRDQWIESPYTKEEVPQSYSFDFNMNINGGMPIQLVSSPSHKIQTNVSSDGIAEVSLMENPDSAANRDIVIRYNLRGEEITGGMLTYKQNGEKFFLLNIQPPKRIETDKIPPREYIFVVDVSGSMSGFPLQTSKKLLQRLVSNLRNEDLFNVILFAGTGQVWKEKSVKASTLNVAAATTFIDSKAAGGGTRLMQAMDSAMELPKQDGYARSIVICSDGYVGNETEVYQTIRKNLGSSNVFSFGIGSGVNRFLMEGMAHVGQGEPFIVLNETEAKTQAEKFKTYIEHPLLTDISVDFDDMEVYDIEPFAFPDLFAERPLIIYGKYKGKAEGTVKVTGNQGSNTYIQEIPLEKARPSKKNKAIRYLWARERIRLLSDYNITDDSGPVSEQVTKLGLDYNLLTEYTSFVAVDKRKPKETPDSLPQRSIQPLPLPQDVQNTAVGQVATVKLNKVQGSSDALTYVACAVAVRAPKVYTDNSVSLAYYNTDNELTMFGLSSLLPYTLSSGNGQRSTINGLPLLSDMTASGRHGVFVPEMLSKIGLSSLQIFDRGYGQYISSGNTGGILDYDFGPNYRSRMELGLRADHYGQVGAAVTARQKLSPSLQTKLSGGIDVNSLDVDRNEDLFLDRPRGHNLFLTNKWTWNSQNSGKYARANAIVLDRQQIWNQLPTSLSSYGTDETHRQYGISALFGTDVLGTDAIQVNLTGNSYSQENTFGIGSGGQSIPELLHNASSRQQSLETRVSYKRGWSESHSSRAIAGFRYSTTDQEWDNMLVSREELIPSLYLNHKWKVNRRLSIYSALKWDYHSIYGNQLNPELHTNYYFNDETAIKLSGSRSYRAANIIYESLPFLVSNRKLSLDETADAEKAWNAGLSFSKQQSIGSHRFYYVLKVQQQWYTNLIVQDMEQAHDELHLYNLDGRASQTHAGIELTWRFHTLKVKGTYKYVDAQTTINGELKQNLLTPKHVSSLYGSYNLNTSQLRLPFSVSSILIFYAGQRYKEGNLDVTSSSILQLDCNATWHPHSNFDLSIGGQNLLDMRMTNPVQGATDPSDGLFDAGQIWGPVLGRRFILEGKWRIPSKN